MPARYRFDRFDLLPGTRQVMENGAPVVLGTRAFDLLQCLVEHRDRVVDKNELMQRVWPATVVGDNNLNVQVSTLRKLLGAHAVVTVAGRGYRFGLELQDEGGASSPEDPGALPAISMPDRPSVVVLPFLDLGSDPSDPHFADGVTEDITTELARFRELFVIARNSAFVYKGRAVDVRTVSRELGVRYVVEGSVRRAGRRVRVVAQLIDATGSGHVWAEKYDRAGDDVFDLQGEVTRAIVTAMAPQIDAAEVSRARLVRPANLDAHGLARQGWAIASAGDMAYDRAPRDQAFRLANEALALDPGCALALRTIALVQWWHAYHGTTESMAETLAQGLAAADLAIARDRSDHHARRWKGLLLALDRRPAEGLAELRQAHEINPNCALTLAWLGLYEALNGDVSKGVPNALAALRLSPRDPSRGACLCALGFAHFVTSDYAAAAQAAQAVLAEAPGTPVGHVLGAISWVGVGELAKARAAFQALQRMAPRLAEVRLGGTWLSTNPDYVRRAHTFLRIAAGLEEPAAADALR